MSDLVPDGWNFEKLDQISRVVDSAHQTPVFSESGYPMVRVGDINGGKVTLENTKFVSKDVFTIFTKNHKPTYNDLLMTRVGSYGRSSIVKSDKEFCLGQNTVVIHPRTVNSDYLHQFLQTENISNQIEDTVGGSSQKSLSLASIKNLKVLTPEYPEQQKIAAILTSVDEVIEKTQAQIDKLKDLKTGMMQELLTSGVGIDGKPHTEFKDTPVGRIPKGWEVLPLCSVVERIIDCEHKTAPYVEKSEYMVVRTSNVRSGELVFEDMKFTHADGYAEWTKRAVPSSGDVMFTREAPAGESCLVPDDLNVCLGQRMVLLRPNTEVILPCFFSLFLTSASAVKSIYELSIGTTVSRINIEDIKKIPCVVPSLAEQLKISNSIQSVQILLNAKRSKLKSVNKTKKALMQDLLTGKVRVTVPSETVGH